MGSVTRANNAGLQDCTVAKIRVTLLFLYHGARLMCVYQSHGLPNFAKNCEVTRCVNKEGTFMAGQSRP